MKDYEYRIVYIIGIIDLRGDLKPDNMSGKGSLGDNSHDNKTINMGDREAKSVKWVRERKRLKELLALPTAERREARRPMG